MEELVLELVQANPKLMMLFVAMGILRAIFKPIMVAVEAYVKSTPWQGDDEWFERVKAGKVYRAVAFLVDYLVSVKLPKAKE
jgi:hypothetical protein